MLAKRVIPCLDVDRGRVVKGVRFVSLRDAGDPVECAARYDAEGADELVLLDITASSEARPILIDVVRRVAAAVYLPFTVGGGVRSVEDADALLRAGADKVAVNTAAVQDPTLLTRLAERFGAQAIALAIDVRRSDVQPESAVGGSGGAKPPSLNEGSHPPGSVSKQGPPLARKTSRSEEGIPPPGSVSKQGLPLARKTSRSEEGVPPPGSVSKQGPPLARNTSRSEEGIPPPGSTTPPELTASASTPRWQVFIHGGRTPTPLDAVEWAREGAARGAGEILLTSMDRDGTKDGFDLALTRAVAAAVRVPVIASGGCGTVAHMAEVLSEGRAAAALAASIFHFGEVRIAAAKAQLRAAGIEVRP